MEKLNVSLSSFRAGDGAPRRHADLIVVWRPPGLRQEGTIIAVLIKIAVNLRILSPWLDAASANGKLVARHHAEWME